MKTIKSDNALVQHLVEDNLISYLDGELPRDEQEQARAHLESCWSCRTRLATRQNSVENFVRLRQEVLLPRQLPPEGPTLNLFRHRLDEHHDTHQTRPRLAVDLARLRTTLRSFVRRFESDRLAFLTSPTAIRTAVAIIAVAILVLIVFRSNRVTTVSANELIQRAIDAQTASLRATAQPVIHQRLQLQRITRTNQETVSWETWNDTINARFNEKCDDCLKEPASKARPDTPPSTSNSLIADLNAVLIANRMEARHPLSAISYQSWHDTLHGQQDEVSRTKLADGSGALILRTLPATPGSTGQITEANFVIRTNDWQPMELRLEVKSESGNQNYQLTAVLSEVISLTQVDPKIFGAASSTASSSQRTLGELEARNSKLETVLPVAPTTSTLAASAELEVEVLRLIHQAGADLGEQVTVHRTAGGPVKVSGIVETDQRKKAIVNALSSLAGNLAVRIDIQTVAEAVALQQSTTGRTKSSPIPEEQVAINREAIAAAPELRRHFQNDDQVREFAARMVSQSNSAMRHVYAMKRLAGQFSLEELRTMTPDAKNKWLALIRSHAGAYRKEAASIQGELRSIYPGASGTAGDTIEMTDDASLVRAVNRLFELAANNDSAIRSSFAMSSANKTASVSSPHFWQSMKSAQALAAAISN